MRGQPVHGPLPCPAGGLKRVQSAQQPETWQQTVPRPTGKPSRRELHNHCARLHRNLPPDRGTIAAAVIDSGFGYARRIDVGAVRPLAIAHLVDVADRSVEQAGQPISWGAVLQLTEHDLLHLFGLGRATFLALCRRQLDSQLTQLGVTVSRASQPSPCRFRSSWCRLVVGPASTTGAIIPLVICEVISSAPIRSASESAALVRGISASVWTRVKIELTSSALTATFDILETLSRLNEPPSTPGA